MSIMGYRDMSSAKAGIECTTGTLVLNQGFCQASARLLLPGVKRTFTFTVRHGEATTHSGIK